MSAVNSLHGAGPMQGRAPAAVPATGAEQRAYEPSMEEILASIRRIIADDQSLPGRSAPDEGGPLGTTLVLGANGGDHAGQAMSAGQAPQAIRIQQAGQSPLAGGPSSAPHPQPPTMIQAIPSVDAFIGSPASVTLLHQVASGRRAEPVASGIEHARHGPDAIGDGHDQRSGAMQGHGFVGTPQFASPTGPTMPSSDQDGPYDDVAEIDVVDDGSSDGSDLGTLVSGATDQSVTGAFNALAAMRLTDNSEDLLGLARDMIRPLLKSWLDDNLPAMVERMVRAEIERVARGGR